MKESDPYKSRFVFAVVLTLGVFAMSARTVSDPDIWWHLRTGQAIWQSHHLFFSDSYSFTRFGQPWVNHEWLTDILIFGLYKSAGMTALTVAFAALTAAGCLFVFMSCRYRPEVAALFTLWGALAAAPTWGGRPQTISFFLAALLWLLLKRSERHRLWVWGSIPLMLLWVNLHAGFAVGIALLTLHAVSVLLDLRLDDGTAGKRLRDGLIALAACLAVIPLNPYGARMYSYPFATLHSAPMQRWITEWASPNFHDAKFAPTLLMILASLGLSAATKTVRPAQILLLSAGVLVALSAIRHIPIYVVLTVPVLSDWSEQWLFAGTNLDRAMVAGAGGTIKRGWSLLIVAAMASFAVARIVAVNRQQAWVEVQQFPARAVDFLVQHPEFQPVFNAYNWGGYLVWRLYSYQRVFIDGRADVYGDEVMGQFADVYSLTHDWQQPLERWDIHSVMVPPDAPIAVALRSSSGWRQAYADGRVEILTKKSGWPKRGDTRMRSESSDLPVPEKYTR